MKAYKVLCPIALLFLSGFSSFSQNQTITLKDGTVYEGYISRQDYTTGHGEITYSRVSKTIPVEDVQGRRTERRLLSDLSKEWQTWAEENNKAETIGKDKYISLTTMTVKDQPSRDYYVLVSGAKYLTVFSISEGTEACEMSEIQSITKSGRSNTLLADLDDIVQTDNATYTGVILEQIPGVSFTIWNKSDRTVHKIDYEEVRSVGKERFNHDYSIWKQAPYLERVHLNNKTTGTGIIVENGFGKDINILFAERNGDLMETRQYRYADIIAIERLRNPEYSPIYDIVLGEGESRVNRDSTLHRIDPIELINKDSTKFFVIDPAKMNLVAQVTNKDVVIETNTPGISDIYIAKAMVLRNMPVSLLPSNGNSQPEKKKGRNEQEETTDLFGYTYTSLFESDIDAKVETSINGTTKISFTLPEPGIFFIYLRKVGTCWAILNNSL